MMEDLKYVVLFVFFCLLAIYLSFDNLMLWLLEVLY